ncbi:MAG: TetR/AcrR family transcriptional regulator [Acidimicrobiia bacterium]
MTPKKKPASRTPLSKARVLHAAIDLADREGLGALTMRRLGAELGFEAMSLYKHVANKEEILEGMVELIVGQIAIPHTGADWKEAMRRRAHSAREVLSQHSWVIGLLEARALGGPAAMRYLNAILGNLMAGGFPIEQAAHAFNLLDCYVYGHVIQETLLAPSAPENPTESAPSSPDHTTMSEYPHLLAMYEHAQTFEYTFDGEFDFGLELILDGLERYRST